jgi:hypothetical protein
MDAAGDWAAPRAQGRGGSRTVWERRGSWRGLFAPGCSVLCPKGTGSATHSAGGTGPGGAGATWP